MKKQAKELLAMAKMMLAAPDELGEAMNTLSQLGELSQNIQESVDTFATHFRLAAMDTEVKGQMELLKKARSGLGAAQRVLEAVRKVLQEYPQDKTALRALKDAEVMVGRFAKHEQDAAKIIRTISKKTMPPSLKKYVASLNRAVSSRLVNPDLLRLTPWQKESFEGGVVYLVSFKVDDGTFKADAIAYEDTGKREGPVASLGDWMVSGKPMSPSEFAGAFLERLKGWSNIKGEDVANAARSQAALGIVSALNTAIARMRAWMDQKAEIDETSTEIGASYRSGLPKEGAQAVGESEYRDMVDDEIGRFKKVVEPLLAPHMSSIAKVRYYDSEKSWIHVQVVLK